MLFSRKKKRPGVEIPPELGTPDWDPLDAIPGLAPHVEARADARNLVQIRFRPPPRTRLGAFLARRLGMQRQARVNLDEQGSFFWRQINGRRDLHAIARAVRRQFNLSEQKAREATILFTRDLMLRGFLQLEITRSGPPPDAAAQGDHDQTGND